MQHGLLGSSDDFMVIGPGLGLGKTRIYCLISFRSHAIQIDFAVVYILADAGYDVWIPNTRGNCYSRHHAYLDPNDGNGEFWDFSWDDAAFQDFPCIFNYIRSITNEQKYFYTGHSQGTSQMLAFLSTYPKWNERFHAISLMAPVAFITNPTLNFSVLRLLGFVANRVIINF